MNRCALGSHCLSSLFFILGKRNSGATSRALPLSGSQCFRWIILSESALVSVLGNYKPCRYHWITELWVFEIEPDWCLLGHLKILDFYSSCGKPQALPLAFRVVFLSCATGLEKPSLEVPCLDLFLYSFFIHYLFYLLPLCYLIPSQEENSYLIFW